MNTPDMHSKTNCPTITKDLKSFMGTLNMIIRIHLRQRFFHNLDMNATYLDVCLFVFVPEAPAPV